MAELTVIRGLASGHHFSPRVPAPVPGNVSFTLRATPGLHRHLTPG